MDKHTIKRDGLPPIAFTGELVGSGSNEIQGGNRANRWTRVEIYRTQGGRYVAAVNRFTIWEGESDHFTATSKPTAGEIVEWLKGDEETLGRVSQEAVEKAVRVDPTFAAAWVESVD